MSDPFTSKCRAKDPTKCPFHGAVLRMNKALENKDMAAYFAARDEAETNINHREPKKSLMDIFDTDSKTNRDHTLSQLSRVGVAVANVNVAEANLKAVETHLAAATEAEKLRRTIIGDDIPPALK